ncbi:MAG: Transcriptional regulator, AbrB family [Parcubacteria group bacterium GW2011_GWA2_40_8]|uniref:SpoVT-AbrB domain-containing protein n=1 Tax=Candidatus Terrybacteria bacterium RIFCSPLOWO2_01_FULL_40_23 TaxID=1802366 RepID=A0A1G2PUC6_9BACT|nr:MAG: Transcriptional regulator, AbrB family [Parcubacteria group bacterium GW2011_GWB1_40_14]KKR79216.1 MAG: Transcriptional regulator, AbrB family [Parcubacteria group bacterium GW2011_GWA2_40_8]OHA51917.1 MAG: hypothetical protein A3A97_01830 [Candidatus Terrybacteria bacterium RIFCSPLOWO2_01_FULL_40_23]
MEEMQNQKFYGTTTLGEKGQVVVPAEARTSMKLGKGEKLLVFGMGEDMLILSKISNLEKFASHLAKKMEVIQNIIDKTTKN